MKRHEHEPNGHFASGTIIYGEFEKDCMVSQGFILEPPDLHNASIAQRNEFQDKLRIFLATLGPKQRAQLQWTCHSDYSRELNRYHEQTGSVTDDYVRAAREERFSRYCQRMHERTLRREHLVLFISHDLDISPGMFESHKGLLDSYDQTRKQFRAAFNEMAITLTTIFGAGTTVTPMSDAEHFFYYWQFLNPTEANQENSLDIGSLDLSGLSIQEWFWNGDGAGDHSNGFFLNANYHAMFTMKRWPQKTYPGIIHHLTALPFLNYQITINIEPIPVREEISKEEKAMDRLRGDYESEGKYSISVALRKKERKIDSLSQGFSFPFFVQYFIRVWDATESGLRNKCVAIKNAVNQMNGAQLYEVALPTTAKKLFYATWPGWTASSYRFRDLYAEDRYLADLLPFSSTFTAHLTDAEAIYDGANNNLVGVRTFIGNTPQHAVLIGMTGAGKSCFMEDLLTQTQLDYQYTVIIEEGLSYKKFTESLGSTPILIHPDGQLTINYLDTQGLPLNQLQIASAVALVSRMIGESSDSEKQQLRQAQIGQYINQLYQDTFEEWSGKHPEKIHGLQRLACAVHGWREKMGLGATFLDAFADLRDRMESCDPQALDFYTSITEGEITRFLKEPQTERFLMQTAYSAFAPDEYPTHSALLDLMFFGRFPEHPKTEIDQIATLLTAWTASGQYGKLFDGVTNISLTGRVAHFELGYIPEQAVELKTAAGLLISGFTRQHIITLPRHFWKRMIFEEAARFLDVPGGEKIMGEGYAQLRKFNCWIISIVQQYSKFKSSRIRPVVMGNSKQFFLMRQFDGSDLEDISRDIKLPEVMVDAVQHYPLPEQQAEGRKFSSLCYYAPSTQPALCGTLRHVSASTPLSTPNH